MGVLQRTENLRGKVHGLLPRQRTSALLEVLLQRDAVHVLHDDVLQLVGDRDVIDPDNIRVVEDGDGLGLVFEAANQLLIIQKFFL